MSQPPAQTTLYSLDRTQSLTTPPSDVEGDRSKDEKAPDDVESNSQTQTPPPEFEQDDGVTRIEALCKLTFLNPHVIADQVDLVFGKGLGLYALWASIGLIAYVYSLSRSTTYYCRCRGTHVLECRLILALDVPVATSSFGLHTIVGTIGVINGILNGVAQPFVAKVSVEAVTAGEKLINRLPTCGLVHIPYFWPSDSTP